MSWLSVEWLGSVYIRVGSIEGSVLGCMVVVVFERGTLWYKKRQFCINTMSTISLDISALGEMSMIMP